MAKTQQAAPTRSMRPGDAATLGARVRAERSGRQWTLAELARRSGLSASTLSKVERGHMSLSYRSLLNLARAFRIDVSRLFTVAPQASDRGKRSVTRRRGGRRRTITGCRLRLLAADLLQKRLVPMVMTVTARTLEEAGGLKCHEGEEVYYVLSGTTQLLTDLYAPLRLEAGDCIYMHGGTGHAFVSVGDEDAVIFAVNEGYPVYSVETGELELTLNEPDAVLHVGAARARTRRAPARRAKPRAHAARRRR